MKKRIAIWHCEPQNFDAITESWPETVDGWTRKSEYITVWFPKLIEPALSHEDYDYE
jgi:hypothetical protein